MDTKDNKKKYRVLKPVTVLEGPIYKFYGFPKGTMIIERDNGFFYRDDHEVGVGREFIEKRKDSFKEIN